jgi:hypothetical protein
MMAAPAKLDGAGTVKMSTLKDSQMHIQRVHGLVEQMAMAQKGNKSTSVLGMQLRRAATPLVGMLKGSFGPMADTVTAMILIATRAGNEGAKVRSLRELIASLKTQLEISTNKVKEHHTIEESAPGE